MKLYEIIRVIEKYAPPALAESYDNVGLLLGDKNREVSSVLFSLDVDMKVAKEAKEKGAELIISHHPLIFHPTKSITADTALGRTILFLAENKIAVYAAHTNLDIVSGGLNDLASELLGLSNTSPLDETEGIGVGRVGTLSVPILCEHLAKYIKNVYNLPFVRYVGDGGKPIKTIALCTGSGGDLLQKAIEKGADAYITGDIKYSVARMAEESGISLIELGHYDSEIIVMDLLEKIVSSYCGNTLSLYKSKENKNVFTTI